METIENEKHISKIGITSGYFNPLHIGHIQLLRDARTKMDFLFVIVNNDRQQILKKGKIIMTEQERFQIVRELTSVDAVVMSVDEDGTVCKTLENIYQTVSKAAVEHKEEAEFYFLKGGDRSDESKVPESVICNKYGIKMLFDVGGNDKSQSSTEINKKTGDE